MLLTDGQIGLVCFVIRRSMARAAGYRPRDRCLRPDRQGAAGCRVVWRGWECVGDGRRGGATAGSVMHGVAGKFGRLIMPTAMANTPTAMLEYHDWYQVVVANQPPTVKM